MSSSQKSKKIVSQMLKLKEELKLLKKQARSKTNKGCVRFDAHHNRWSFTWREDGVQKNKYFSVKKLGSDAKAKRAAEQARKRILQGGA